MKQRTTILRENHDALPQSSSPNPTSLKQKPSNSPSNTMRKNKSSKENAPPPYHPLDLTSSPSVGSKIKSPLPPRPPNNLKRKLNLESVGSDNTSTGSSDSGVKVIVRMRPPTKDEEEGEVVVQKISNDALSIAGHTFTFDSIADAQSTQVDIFQHVGAPVVDNCLAGFNSSVFAYGQTGSGKTYTIWGPTNALLGENLTIDQQGLAPRVFQRLFERIEEEQIKHADKQLMYQCRCSFLEIYNEQITDLLDPTQKNLQIREDVKTGVYVENLTEECVSSMKDVTKLLMKGVSNRRTGATSVNAESSRSHSVFTCVVESRCKSMADGISHLKRSRINLVDLAGSERQKLTGAAGERLKEAGNINKSLSQLGNLINILAEVSQTGKHRHIPYRDSKLTFLLQESLGGNAKLAMICAVSPSQNCKSETLSTLRFAQRAKAIKNKAVINEEMQDDVNVLREVIRQLREELLRMKANGYQADQAGWSVRRSLNLLKFSLNHPMNLPVDDEGDTEMEIVEEAELLGLLSGGSKENSMLGILRKTFSKGSSLIDSAVQHGEKEYGCNREQVSEDTDVTMDEEVSEAAGEHESSTVDGAGPHDFKKLGDDSSMEPTEDEYVLSSASEMQNQGKEEVVEDSPSEKFSERTPENSSKSLERNIACTNLSIAQCDVLPTFDYPAPSVSPRANSSTKSLGTSVLSVSKKDLGDKLDTPDLFFTKPSNSICLNSPSQRNKSCFTSTEHLAASLQRGLEIISTRQSTSLRRSSVRFSSCKAADISAIIPVAKVDVGVQTVGKDDESFEGASMFLCSKCKARNSLQELKDADDGSNLQLVPVNGLQLVSETASQSCENFQIQVPKAVEKVLAGAIRREMALEEICSRRTSEITQLNRLIQQYKHERECNAIISQTREDKIIRLESYMDGILSKEEFMEDELLAVIHEHKLLKAKYENHPEVLSERLELRRVQEELERYRNFFDLGERDVLLEEIQDLRSQLQFYVDFSPRSSKKENSLLQLTYPCEPSVPPTLSTIPESNEESSEQSFERERIQWTETESKWISLIEELRLDLQSTRTLSEKRKQELDLEKKCSEELKEAMERAMQGHARMIEQYAELEERHIQLLARHRKVQVGIEDVKNAAIKAGVRGAESKFINALAAEISALRVERENERRYFRDENKELQNQLRDTAEAVQAAGELLARLKEAEEDIAAAEKRAIHAEKEASEAYRQIDKLKKKHEEVNSLRGEPRIHTPEPVYDKTDTGDDRWREEFAPFYNTKEEEELPKFGEPSSWFSGYDRCNV
ncbi:kinesin-like protein KIN-12B isoform X1 [Capsicum chacoense]